MAMGVSWEGVDLLREIERLTDRELAALYAAVRIHPGEGAVLVVVVQELKKRNLWSDNEGGVF